MTWLLRGDISPKELLAIASRFTANWHSEKSRMLRSSGGWFAKSDKLNLSYRLIYDQEGDMSSLMSEATSNASKDAALRAKVRQLGPWHMNISLTKDLSTGEVSDITAEDFRAEHLSGVSIISPRDRFVRLIKKIYPNGLKGKRFLDCACNAGGYCFWMRELDANSCIGFDVREHWINQAQFIQQHRTVASTDRIDFKVMDLYQVPELRLQPVDVTMFKGIFYHLPDPITGLKIAADLTNEVMWFNTQTLWGQKDGNLRLGVECKEHVMSGVHGLKWYPTGPQVLADILSWLGFIEMKLMFYNQNEGNPDLGRLEIIAAKKRGLLDRLDGGQAIGPAR